MPLSINPELVSDDKGNKAFTTFPSDEIVGRRGGAPSGRRDDNSSASSSLFPFSSIPQGCRYVSVYPLLSRALLLATGKSGINKSASHLGIPRHQAHLSGLLRERSMVEDGDYGARCSLVLRRACAALQSRYIRTLNFAYSSASSRW